MTEDEAYKVHIRTHSMPFARLSFDGSVNILFANLVLQSLE